MIINDISQHALLVSMHYSIICYNCDTMDETT